MKRNYPLFLIDRTKSATYPFDFIASFDRTVGFVARVVYLPSDPAYFEFIKQQSQIENAEYFSITLKFKTGGVVVLAEDFLYFFELTTDNKKRVQTLLKKAMKKYLHAEVERTPADGLDVDNQIKQQQLTIERAKQNYDDLVSRANGDPTIADYQIALAEATLETLKKYRDNQKLFASWN